MNRDFLRASRGLAAAWPRSAASARWDHGSEPQRLLGRGIETQKSMYKDVKSEETRLELDRLAIEKAMTSGHFAQARQPC